MKLEKCKQGINGQIFIPGDKSISHRAVMFGSLAKGRTIVKNFLMGEDCLSTIACFKQLGVQITIEDETVIIDGEGIKGLEEPKEVLNVGNSGTTIRLMSGILSRLPFHSTLVGDDSISKRPMQRVVLPLREMGARIDGRENGKFTPLAIRGGELEGITYLSPVASAQVKSAILLAGLGAQGETKVIEPSKSRDHTERMLRLFGVDVKVNDLEVSVNGNSELEGTVVEVPGDISSAAFWLVGGAIVPNSQLLLENVGLNPTRSGIVDVLSEMGANLTIGQLKNDEFEPQSDIKISSSSLKGIVIEGDIIPRLIDEIPIIALAATQAQGVTIIKDAQELKVKETDRIGTIVSELTKMGAKIRGTSDGMIIEGPTQLYGANVNSHGDHRIGMMLAIASLIAEGPTVIENAEAVSVSYPTFFKVLKEVM